MKEFKINIQDKEIIVFQDDDGCFIKPEIVTELEKQGTATKPSHEPICMARKPLAEKTVAENCLKWGTGGINIDESRIDVDMSQEGRFPANLIHDNSEEVRECFPETKSTKLNSIGGFGTNNCTEGGRGTIEYERGFNDSGNASRFFKSIIYTAKASKSERNKGCEDLPEKVFSDRNPELDSADMPQNRSGNAKSNFHPTVKPIALMEYLIKMVTPKGGVVLDPFAGSGTTLVAAKQKGFQYVGIEMTEEYIPIIEARLKSVSNLNVFVSKEAELK